MAYVTGQEAESKSWRMRAPFGPRAGGLRDPSQLPVLP